MGAPGGGLKQCAQGWGQDRMSVGSPHMPKATFPFVTARQWVDGWRLFFLNTATVSAGHSAKPVRPAWLGDDGLLPGGDDDQMPSENGQDGKAWQQVAS